MSFNLSPQLKDELDANGQVGEVLPTSTIIPEELCSVPGLVNDHIDYTMSISVYPNRRTAFVGALAFLSFAASRRYRTVQGTRPNLYLIATAKSGAGKEAPRKTNMILADACGAHTRVFDAISSGEGLEDFIIDYAKGLMQYDEIDTMVREISQSKTGTKEYLVKTLLALFTKSDGYIVHRKASTSMGSKNNDKICKHPCLTIFGTCVPKYLYEVLNGRMLTNGIMGRFAIFDCGRRGDRANGRYSPPPLELVEKYRYVFGSKPTGDPGRFALPDVPTLMRPEIDSPEGIIQMTAEAEAMIEEMSKKWKSEYDAFEDSEDSRADAWQSVSARAEEMVTKYAMLYALSEHPYEPLIDTDAVSWGNNIFAYTSQAMRINSAKYGCENEFDGLMRRVMESFSRRAKQNRRQISKNLRIPIQDLNQVLEVLIFNGEIREIGNDVYVRA